MTERELRDRGGGQFTRRRFDDLDRLPRDPMTPMENYRADVLAELRQRPLSDELAARIADEAVAQLKEKIRELVHGMDGSFTPRGILCPELLDEPTAAGLVAAFDRRNYNTRREGAPPPIGG